MFRRRTFLNAVVALLYCLASVTGVGHAMAGTSDSGRTIWICTGTGFAQITVSAEMTAEAPVAQPGDADEDGQGFQPVCPLCAAAKSLSVPQQIDIAFIESRPVAALCFPVGDTDAVPRSLCETPEARGPPLFL